MAEVNLPQVKPAKDLKSFLGWMDNLLITLGNGNALMLSNLVQEFGVAYQRRSPSPEEEVGHYLYHYGEIQEPKCIDLVAKRGRIYLENGSHEWIAVALSILGISLKYLSEELKSPGETIGGGFKIEDFLKEWPVDKQVAECRDFLKKDLGKMRDDHRRAYRQVLEGLCEKAGVKVEESSGGDEGEGYFAALNFLKGFYLDLMGFRASDSMVCYLEAKRLEIEYYFWWHVAYLKARTLTRLGSRGFGIGPTRSEKLMDYADEAYELAPVAPKEIKARMGIGWVLAAVELETTQGERFRTVETWELLSRLLIGARLIGKEGNQLHRKWICLKLSELVIRFGTSEEEVRMGRELLEELVRDWPECSLTLGAAAVLNYYGCLDGKLVDKEKGIDLYTRAQQYYPGPLTNITDYFQFNVVKRKVGEIPVIPINSGGVLEVNLKDEEVEKMESWGKLNIEDCGLECPPLWLASMIDKVLGQCPKNLSAYLKDRIEKMDVSQPNTRRRGDLEATTLMVDWLCANIFICSVYIHMKWEWKPGVTGVLTADRNRKVFKEMERYVPEGHHKAYQYLLQAMGVCLSLTRFQALLKDEEQKDRVKKEVGLKLQKKIQFQAEMWEEVKHSPVICFVKGKLAEMLGLEGNFALEQFRMAMELQPGYSLWQQSFQRKQMQLKVSGANLDSTGRGNEDQAIGHQPVSPLPEEEEEKHGSKKPRLEAEKLIEKPLAGCGRGRKVRRILL